MNDVYLFIFALAIANGLLLIYAMMRFSSLKERLDVLEKNFGEANLDCYDDENGGD